ncbi:MAG TPA: hypothetical protein VKY24_10870 [Reyranella sp.]|nr:hypothetical protein [Reyranella sp.]
MNVLIESPLGGLLARPWLDAAGLFGLRRYMPLSRLWAAANAAKGDVAAFRDQVGSLPAFWSAFHLRPLLAHHDRLKRAADDTRRAWEMAIFDPAQASAAGLLDDRRRRASTSHQMTRAYFAPMLFPRRPSLARWQIDPPGAIDTDPSMLYRAAVDPKSVAASRRFVRNALAEYWLRALTPSARLSARPGSDRLYARVIEPADGAAADTLIFGSGLCLEFDVLSVGGDPGRQLAAMGWRVIEPISPYHGLRAMPGFYGGEPFFALAPTGTLDLIAGQAIETALLTAWARLRFGGTVSVAGISMSSFVAQQVASRCDRWPREAQPDAVLLISHSGRLEAVTFGGALASLLGIDRALQAAGWTRETLAAISQAIDPTERPALASARIVSVLGETDRWVPYDHGLALARQWRLPEENVFRYRVGHLGMPVQLTRDPLPFERLRQVLRAR